MAPCSIVLHAGAGESYRGDSDSTEDICRFLQELAADSKERLRLGVSAVDVVVDVTAALEDCPYFNAGKGASLNIAGWHELEAAVIDGNSSEYRAVAGVQRTRNPIRLAQALLNDPGAAFIVGPNTDVFAASHGLAMVDNAYYTVAEKQIYWTTNLHKHRHLNAEHHGTVGAVALDLKGNLAAGNSTGGTMFKAIGRIGDTAINGAGIYADEDISIVCSGSGEAILKSRVASCIANSYHAGIPLETAVQKALQASASLSIESSCGVVAVTKTGDIATICNARTFAVAHGRSDGPVWAGIIPNSLTHLDKLVSLETSHFRLGYAKYPTIDAQVTIEMLHHTNLMDLDRHAFDEIFETLSFTSHALMAAHKKPCCSCIAEGDKILIAPHSSMDSLDTVTKQLGQTPAATEPVWAWLHSRRDSASESSQSENVALAQSASTASANSRIAIHFIGREKMLLESYNYHEEPIQFPCPARFHTTYSRHISMRDGPRASNLPGLVKEAQELAETFQTSLS